MPTVADILKGHITLDIESFDRLYLNGWIPKLQTPESTSLFLNLSSKGNKIASPVLLGEITKDFVKQVEEFIQKKKTFPV